jgi:hypothetical protein
LEEFPLIKYNKKLKPKSIYFCIDGFNITNRDNKDKNAPKQSGGSN